MPDISRRRPLGAPVMPALSAALRSFYEIKFRACMEAGQPWIHDRGRGRRGALLRRRGFAGRFMSLRQRFGGDHRVAAKKRKKEGHSREREPEPCRTRRQNENH